MSPLHHKDGPFIAEYTLGLLEPDDIARAHSLLGADDAAVVCALQWEARLLALTDVLTPLHPPADLLDRIHDTLGLPRAPTPSATSAARPPVKAPEPVPEPRLLRPDLASVTAASQPAPTAPARDSRVTGASDASTQTPGKTRNAPTDPTETFRREAASRRPARRSIFGALWFWRFLAASLGLLVIALLLPKDIFRHEAALSASLEPAASPAPTIVQVAVMQAPGTSSTPGWILTVDSRKNVMLEPKVDIVIPASDKVYLWTYLEHLPQPRLLGVIDPQTPLTLPVEVTGEVVPGQIFEMTQEPGSSIPHEPSGPILFIGRSVSLG